MKIKKAVEWIIFQSKWLLVIFYLKLIVTLCSLMYHFVIEGHLTNSQLVQILEDVDIVMIANLVKMIITGSYHSFVSKSHRFEPEHTSSGILKIKMATSIIGVATIQLLQTFLNADIASFQTVFIQLVILLFFIVAALSLAYIDYLHARTESYEKTIKNN